MIVRFRVASCAAGNACPLEGTFLVRVTSCSAAASHFLLGQNLCELPHSRSAIVWLFGGGMALYAALARSRWGVAPFALAGLFYGIAWLRVACRARLLTWSELIVPWRAPPAQSDRRP